MTQRRKQVPDVSRRRFVAALSATVGSVMVAGCDRLSRTEWLPGALGLGEWLSMRVHRLFLGDSLAQEFTEADLSPDFRSNGTADPQSDAYQKLVADGFAQWSLVVDGLVESPRNFTLAELRGMPSRTQITRHDCVEGWSAIGKWTGVPLAAVLDAVKPKGDARFVVFHCADPMREDGTEPYYESIDMVDARHPQTILAYGLNGADLPVKNGAPLRLRVERQLGYKQAKYLMRIELVSSFAAMRGGRGGYWEDRGYQWYAGL